MAVESVNGKTGVVVLTASNVEAVPTSEVGKPKGVAELNSEGKLVEGELPSSVVRSSTEPLAISGTPSAGEILTATGSASAEWDIALTGATSSLFTALGAEALNKFKGLSIVEQGVHSGNTAIGLLAMHEFNGLIGTYAPTSDTAIGSSVINVTGIESEAGPVWEGGTSNTPIIVFRKLTPGVTGLSTGVAYYVVKGTANSFECATTLKGVGIKVAGHALETGSTEIALLASGEDNTVVGRQAGAFLITGGGNTLIGENAGVNLVTGEENVVVGCEALASQQEGNGNIAIGFRALGGNETGGGLVAIGYGAGEGNTTGNYNTALGNGALQSNETGQRNTAIGFEAARAATGEENTMVGALAGKAVTSGEENVMIGCMAANALTTGNENAAIGVSALFTNKTGVGNVAVGNFAGEKNTGSKNIFLGYSAGENETGSDKLYIANSGTAEPLIKGEFPNAELAFNATKMGFFKKTPIAQPAKPAATVAAIIKVLEELGLVA
jgi:hypothetical protein